MVVAVAVVESDDDGSPRHVPAGIQQFGQVAAGDDFMIGGQEAHLPIELLLPGTDEFEVERKAVLVHARHDAVIGQHLHPMQRRGIDGTQWPGQAGPDHHLCGKFAFGDHRGATVAPTAARLAAGRGNT